MAATAGHRLTLNPMGKCSNAFFSETTNMIKAKLYMNVHWMVLDVFCSDMKFKMAATAELSLTDSLIYLIHFLVNSLSIGNTRLMYFSHDNQKQVIVK